MTGDELQNSATNDCSLSSAALVIILGQISFGNLRTNARRLDKSLKLTIKIKTWGWNQISLTASVGTNQSFWASAHFRQAPQQSWRDQEWSEAKIL
ncbi:hypothetical protein BJY01DRAFT_223281 [Aspergillus pseudoustus]|uniref:Uncharacterized protein n=1 Tax=Aspergillus pseudoustus TaxID=1810923 RepID=A0ABR4J6P9_9EURO